jgi:hypothetical protein
MNFSRIVTIVTLCSLSGVSFVAGLLGVFHTQSNNPSPPDGDKDATKPDQKNQKPKPKPQTAIATPEKLPHQLANKAQNQAKKQRISKAVAQKLAKPPFSLTESLPNVIDVNQDPSNAKSAADSEEFQARSTRSTGAIAAPETISSAQSANSRQSDPATDASLAFMVPLRDIQGHWAQYYIEDLAAKGIIQGFPDRRFRPNQPVTPTEFATMAQNAFQDSSYQRPSYQELQARSSSGTATRADAAAFIHRVLSKSEPALIVTKVDVDGEVVRPGSYSLAAASDARLGKGNDFPTVSRAIQQAGGSLTSADLHQVEIHRTTEMGAKRVIKVDVSKMIETGDRTQDLVLQQDDKLVIPTAVSKVRPAIAPPEKLSTYPNSVQPTPQSLKPETQLLELDSN